LPPANRTGFPHCAGRSSWFRRSRCWLARLPASRRNRAPLHGLLRHLRHDSLLRLGQPDTATEHDGMRHAAMNGSRWSMQSFVLSPACRAGAHVCVGIAGPHIHSRALVASEKASSPARYRALRIRIDPPESFPPRRHRRILRLKPNYAGNRTVARSASPVATMSFDALPTDDRRPRSHSPHN